MVSVLIRIVLPLLIILAFSEVSRRMPRFGALLLRLPLVSILAFGAAWYRDRDLQSLSAMARETLILVLSWFSVNWKTARAELKS